MTHWGLLFFCKSLLLLFFMSINLKKKCVKEMLIVIAPQWLYTKNTFRYFWQPFCWIIMSRNNKNYILISENIASLSIMMFFCFPCLCWHNKEEWMGEKWSTCWKRSRAAPLIRKLQSHGCLLLPTGQVTFYIHVSLDAVYVLRASAHGAQIII